MGYACPVCETPQSDAGHLANHVAFTALLRGGDHETWLDEYVPEWEALGEAALGDRVAEHAATVEYPQVFEDTTGQESPSEPSPGHGAQAPEERERGSADHGQDGHPGRIPGPGDPPDSMAALLDGVDFSALRADENVDDEDLDEIIARAKELTSQRRAESETE